LIYFLQPVDGGPVKIGYSADVATRHRQLETRYGLSLALLATMPGGRSEEQAIHDRFSHLRFGRTEQFKPSHELMEFISRPLLVAANPETTEAIEAVSQLTLLSLKGLESEKEFLKALSRKTGVSASEIARRGMAMWATKRGAHNLPENWIEE
jgi:hypothetical protein